MTIAAGFALNSEIVLCADTQESTGDFKFRVPKLEIRPRVAKLLNRSGWKGLPAFLVLMMACFQIFQPVILSAQQGTNLTNGSSSNSIGQKTASSSPTTNADSFTKTNQQPQHRVSVAPQGGELGKRTGA